MLWWDSDNETQRIEFSIATKRVEWLRAAKTDTAKEVLQKYAETRKPPPKMPRSRCRVCKTTLTWGSGTYAFDHFDNRSYNTSQRNCYLVCRNCHGKGTKTRQVAVYDADTGEYMGTTTQKLKVGYKKTAKKPARKTAKKPASKTARKPARKAARRRR
jgi:hypothetical protein